LASGRLRFIPFWHLTYYGWVRPFRFERGCDEWHNKSIMFRIPFVGEWDYFKTNNRGGWHVYAMRKGRVIGLVVPGCSICLETLEWFTEGEAEK
jgi:hypothetical protein